MSAHALDALCDREYPRARRDAAYLNCASTGPLPERAVRALAHENELRAEPWCFSPDRQFATVARSRELAARLIGASPREIALMTNTSYGLNFAARALALRAGDRVVISDRDFPANVYPWLALEANGVVVDRVPCAGRLFDEDALLRALEQPRVRVLAASWVSFETGITLDLARLGQACRARGVTFVVDAIQGLGARTLDVRATPIDILSCGAQKWLCSGWGTAFTYVRDALIPQLEPHDVGWMSVEDSDDFSRMLDYALRYRGDARRFEVVTLPFHDFAAFNASLEIFFEAGPSAVAARVAEHAARMSAWATAAAGRGVGLLTPTEAAQRAGIVSVIPRDARRASDALAAAGVTHSLREGAIRLSPHFFTPVAHVERALEVLASV